MIQWPVKNPFIHPIKVQTEQIDGLNHVNNKVYLDWVEKVSWLHSLAVGIDQQVYEKAGKVMVIRQHELNYHASAKCNDDLLFATWVDLPSSQVKRTRHFMIKRPSDGKKIFSGHTIWVCMEVATQKACKIPDNFITPYLTNTEEKI